MMHRSIACQNLEKRQIFNIYHYTKSKKMKKQNKAYANRINEENIQRPFAQQHAYLCNQSQYNVVQSRTGEYQSNFARTENSFKQNLTFQQIISASKQTGFAKHNSKIGALASKQRGNIGERQEVNRQKEKNSICKSCICLDDLDQNQLKHRINYNCSQNLAGKSSKKSHFESFAQYVQKIRNSRQASSSNTNEKQNRCMNTQQKTKKQYLKLKRIYTQKDQPVLQQVTKHKCFNSANKAKIIRMSSAFRSLFTELEN